MADQVQKQSFNRLRTTQPAVIPKPPAFPDDVKKRFPSMQKHEEAMVKWFQEQLGIVIRG